MARKRVIDETDDTLPRGVSWDNAKQRWQIQYSDQFGQRRREYFTSLRTAKATVKERRATVKRLRLEGARPVSQAPLFLDVLRDYLQESRATKRSWREDVRHARQFGTQWADRHVDEISADDIRRWRQERLAGGYRLRTKDPGPTGDAKKQTPLLQHRPATINRELAFLKRVFSLLIKSGRWSGPNPTHTLDMLSERNGTFLYLTVEQEAEIKPLLPVYVWQAVAVAIDTGLRQAELFSVRRDNIDLQNRIVTVTDTKNGRVRHVNLTPRADRIFRELLAEHDGPWVFRGRLTGGHLSYHAVRYHWEKALKAIGLEDFRWHDLRHTFASRMVMAGADLITVKELLGHSSLAMVQRYAHLSPEHRKAAVERMSEHFREID